MLAMPPPLPLVAALLYTVVPVSTTVVLGLAVAIPPPDDAALPLTVLFVSARGPSLEIPPPLAAGAVLLLTMVLVSVTAPLRRFSMPAPLPVVVVLPRTVLPSSITEPAPLLAMPPPPPLPAALPLIWLAVNVRVPAL